MHNRSYFKTPLCTIVLLIATVIWNFANKFHTFSTGQKFKCCCTIYLPLSLLWSAYMNIKWSELINKTTLNFILWLLHVFNQLSFTTAHIKLHISNSFSKECLIIMNSICNYSFSSATLQKSYLNVVQYIFNTLCETACSMQWHILQLNYFVWIPRIHFSSCIYLVGFPIWL